MSAPWPHGLKKGDLIVVLPSDRVVGGSAVAGQVLPIAGYIAGDPSGHPWQVDRWCWVRDVRPATPEEQARYWLEHEKPGHPGKGGRAGG